MVLPGCSLHEPGDVGEERVGYVRDDEPDCPGFALPQTFGRNVRRIVHFYGDTAYLFSHFRSDSVFFLLVVQHKRYQRCRYIGLLGDVLE